MLEISYTPSFVRQYNDLDAGLQDEVADKIQMLKDRNNHKSLKVHKLHGKLNGRYSFSVNYKIRVVFEYIGIREIRCHVLGDHDLYK